DSSGRQPRQNGPPRGFSLPNPELAPANASLWSDRQGRSVLMPDSSDPPPRKDPSRRGSSHLTSAPLRIVHGPPATVPESAALFQDDSGTGRFQSHPCPPMLPVREQL